MTPYKLHAIITDELNRRQLGKVTVVVTPEWEAILSGTLAEDSQKNSAIDVIKGHNQIKKLVDNVVILPSTSSVEEKIKVKLRDMGFVNVRVSVDKDFMVTFTGIVRSDAEKAQVFAILASFREITSSPRDLIFVAPE